MRVIFNIAIALILLQTTQAFYVIEIENKDNSKNEDLIRNLRAFKKSYSNQKILFNKNKNYIFDIKNNFDKLVSIMNNPTLKIKGKMFGRKQQWDANYGK